MSGREFVSSRFPTEETGDNGGMPDAAITTEPAAALDDDAADCVRSFRPGIPYWLPLGILLLAVGSSAAIAAGPVGDPDTWWHLRLGEEFRGNWSLGDPGQLSPFATRPWFATQWTLELLASYFEQAFGIAGVSWLAGVGVLALGFAVFVACRLEASPLPAALATVLALIGASQGMAPRPQLAGFVFAVVVTGAWLRTERDLKPRWWLIPLAWLWACTHGLWFTSVIIGLAVVVGLLLDRRVTWREIPRFLAIPILSLVAAGITPVGPKLLIAPLATSGMAPFVTEWQSPSFTQPAVATTAVMLMLTVVTWSRGIEASWSRLLLLILAAGWTVLSYRTVALGAVIAAPLLAAALQSWLKGRSREPVSLGERKCILLGALVCMVGLTIAVPTLSERDEPESRALNAALDALPDGTIVYNDYAVGGWLTWKHRNIAPVVDGMTDAYEVSHVAGYVETSRLRKDWYRFITKTGAEYALLYQEAPLAIELQNHMGWVSVASGRGLPIMAGADLVLLRRAEN